MQERLNNRPLIFPSREEVRKGVPRTPEQAPEQRLCSRKEQSRKLETTMLLNEKKQQGDTTTEYSPGPLLSTQPTPVKVTDPDQEIQAFEP